MKKLIFKLIAYRACFIPMPKQFVLTAIQVYCINDYIVKGAKSYMLKDHLIITFQMFLIRVKYMFQSKCYMNYYLL